MVIALPTITPLRGAGARAPAAKFIVASASCAAAMIAAASAQSASEPAPSGQSQTAPAVIEGEQFGAPSRSEIIAALTEVKKEVAALQADIAELNKEVAANEKDMLFYKKRAEKFEALLGVAKVDLNTLQISMRKNRLIDDNASLQKAVYDRFFIDAVIKYQGQNKVEENPDTFGWPSQKNGWLTSVAAIELICSAAVDPDKRDPNIVYKLAEMYLKGWGFPKPFRVNPETETKAEELVSRGSLNKSWFLARDAKIILEAEKNNPFNSEATRSENEKLLKEVNDFLAQDEFKEFESENSTRPKFAYNNQELCSLDDFKVSSKSVAAIKKRVKKKIEPSLKKIDDALKKVN